VDHNRFRRDHKQFIRVLPSKGEKMRDASSQFFEESLISL